MSKASLHLVYARGEDKRAKCRGRQVVNTKRKSRNVFLQKRGHSRLPNVVPWVVFFYSRIRWKGPSHDSVFELLRSQAFLGHSIRGVVYSCLCLIMVPCEFLCFTIDLCIFILVCHFFFYYFLFFLYRIYLLFINLFCLLNIQKITKDKSDINSILLCYFTLWYE